MEKVRFREYDFFGHLNQYEKLKFEILMHNYLQMKSANWKCLVLGLDCLQITCMSHTVVYSSLVYI